MVAETAFTNMTVALAHELKNPAALALAHVALLRCATNHTEIQSGVAHIERALESIVQLAQEMLSVSQGIPLAFDFDLHELTSEVVALYQSAKPGVRFILPPPTLPLTLRAPEIYVRMVISNLIKNAVETDCGEVSIHTGIKNETAYIIIRDTGPGYDEARINALNNKPYGNGLGLPIARWLLERLGGQLTLRPGSLCGCEAVVQLPMASRL